MLFSARIILGVRKRNPTWAAPCAQQQGKIVVADNVKLIVALESLDPRFVAAVVCDSGVRVHPRFCSSTSYVIMRHDNSFNLNGRAGGTTFSL